MGDTDILHNTKTDSIKYLKSLCKNFITELKNDNLVNLSDNEFYLVR